MQEFLDSYPSVFSNQRKTKIKPIFLNFVTTLVEQKVIEPHYQVLSQGNWKSVTELTVSNISEGFSLSERFTIGSDKSVNWRDTFVTTKFFSKSAEFVATKGWKESELIWKESTKMDLHSLTG